MVNNNVFITQYNPAKNPQSIYLRPMLFLIKTTFGEGQARIAYETLEKTNSLAVLCLRKWKESEKVIGCAVAKPIAKHIEVDFIATTSGCRRQGIGTELMRGIFQVADEKNFQVTLSYNCLKYKRVKFYHSLDPKIRDSRNAFWKLVAPHLARPVYNPQRSLTSIAHRFSTKTDQVAVSKINRAALFYSTRIIRTYLVCLTAALAILTFAQQISRL